jgi:hypothetical protein
MFFTLTIFIPGRFPINLSCSIASYSRIQPLEYKADGERGHPCLNPRLIWKKGTILPFTSGEIHGVLMQEDAIHLMTKGLKPNLCMTLKRNECLTQSKEFSMSILIIIPLSLLALLK